MWNKQNYKQNKGTFHFFIVSDDGKLSFDGFKAYFADGILSGEELHELFHTIDTHNNE